MFASRKNYAAYRKRGCGKKDCMRAGKKVDRKMNGLLRMIDAKQHRYTCALCMEEVPELCRSHILPESFYSTAYDTKGRFPIFSSGSARPIGKLQQLGLREALLGQCCENKLSAWETYALGLMWNRTHEVGVDHGDHYVFRADYAKLKLFYLSLLWRMGVAKHEVFSGVQLGPKHTDRLHCMLRDSDPGREQCQNRM